MSLSKKVIIIITLVVFAAFSAGGTVLLATNSRAALAESVAQNSRRKQMSCYALESKLLADRLNGRKTDKTELARYADKMVAYATGEEIEIIDSNGQVIFSNLKGDAPVLRQNSYSVEKNENGYFNCFNATLSSYGTELNIIMRYDISYVFAERKRQYIAFLLIESAVLLCSGLAAFFITKRITRPLERLAQTANRISGGEYSLRTRIDSGDEIGSLSKSFDAMVAELEQQLENRTAFVADFSHELKTPMTSVIGYADILRTHVLDEHDKFMYADRIFKNAKRMENLSVKMLRMLKLSQTEPTLEPVESECIERGIRQMFENGENLDINSEKGIKILCDYDLLGFQTENDRLAFLDCLSNLTRVTTRSAKSHTACGKAFRTEVYPIGIEPKEIAKQAAGPLPPKLAQLKAELKNVQNIFSVERLDYSKGLPERFLAYEALLEKYPQHHGKIRYTQIAPTSRGDVQAYQDIRHQLENEAGRINGKYGQLGWTPLYYLNQHFDRKLLMKIFRYSDVGLVTPLRDGMNLVAKEYVAAQDPANPGVLVLSQFAGAANELTSALIVNPYDRDEVAAALDRALTMSLAERISRHAEMLDVIVKNDINHWQECFISDLKQIVPRSAESQQRDKVATFPKLA